MLKYKELKTEQGLTVSYGDNKQRTYFKIHPTFWQCIKLAFTKYKTITVSFEHEYTHHQMQVINDQYSNEPLKFKLSHLMMSSRKRGIEDGKYGRDPNPELTDRIPYCTGYASAFKKELVHKWQDIYTGDSDLCQT